MSLADKIKEKLAAALSPQAIEVIDESDKHIGHAGHDGRGESHFRLKIVSSAFGGKSRLERQRLVYGLLAEEMAGRIHALSLSLKTPEEISSLP